MTIYALRSAAIEACNDATAITGQTHSVVQLGVLAYIVVQGTYQTVIYNGIL